MTNVRLECRCGQMRGAAEVAPTTGNRAICYCRDCQAYAHYLGPADILDSHGGSDIFQMTPSHLAIDSGAKHLACVRLTKDGLLRWYASCCRTPVGNTVRWSRLPFVGVVQPFMKHSVEHPRDEVLGPVRSYSNAENAVGGLPPGASGKTKPSNVARGVGLLLAGALRGAHQPSPFFGRDGKPTVTPAVLSEQERAALYAEQR